VVGAAGDVHLVQHPWRAAVTAPQREAPTSSKGQAEEDGDGRGDAVLAAVEHATGFSGARSSLLGIAGAPRHRAHLHPDATAPPITR
jgi:hypothetical protein